jgi:hypothetical protein
MQGRGYITRAQFIEGYKRFFLPSSPYPSSAPSAGSSNDSSRGDPTLARLLARLDPRTQDRIDYIEWSNTLTLRDVPDLTRCLCMMGERKGRGVDG